MGKRCLLSSFKASPQLGCGKPQMLATGWGPERCLCVGASLHPIRRPGQDRSERRWHQLGERRGRGGVHGLVAVALGWQSPENPFGLLERQVWCQEEEQGGKHNPGLLRGGGEGMRGGELIPALRGEGSAPLPSFSSHGPGAPGGGGAGGAPRTSPEALGRRGERKVLRAAPPGQRCRSPSGLGWAALRPSSCGPGDGGAVLLGLHAQRRDAGALAVRLRAQLVAVQAGPDAGRAEEASHVRLRRGAARAAQELGDAAGGVGVAVGRHAGGQRLAGHHAGGHGRGGAAAADPGGVLDLGRTSRVRAAPCGM